MTSLLIKPAISAGLGALAFRQLFGSGTQIEYFGQVISITTAGAAIGAMSHVVTEAASMFILPHITKDRRLRHLESMALSLGVSGLTFWAIPRFLAKGGESTPADTAQNFVVAGVFTEVIAQWIYESFFTGEAALFQFN